ncbi:MAG: serine/threonine protein kinase, partial [Solirubrobacterales bacterium]
CLTALAAASTASLGPGLEEAPASKPGPKQRDVLLVANILDGTVDVIAQRRFQRVDRIDVAPDYRDCVAAATPGQARECVVDNELVDQGKVLLVDDLRPSPDGKVLYVSRPSLGDVAALSLRTEKLLWSVDVSGGFADHLALSPDGTRLLVSARAADAVEVIDTRSAAVVDRFPTGDVPHGNEYSADGARAYNGSLGRGIAPDAAQCGCWLTVVDAATMDVEQVAEFDQGVRPFAVTSDGRRAYVQLSFLHGFAEYSLAHDRLRRTATLPVPGGSDALDSASNPGAVAHHGLALNADETKICAAATVSDYVAIVRRRSLSLKRAVPVGDEPYWATSSRNGRYCFVPNRGSDDVSVISYRKAKEIARIPVGDTPQRIRTARVRVR